MTLKIERAIDICERKRNEGELRNREREKRGEKMEGNKRKGENKIYRYRRIIRERLIQTGQISRQTDKKQKQKESKSRNENVKNKRKRKKMRKEEEAAKVKKKKKNSQRPKEKQRWEESRGNKRRGRGIVLANVREKSEGRRARQRVVEKKI